MTRTVVIVPTEEGVAEQAALWLARDADRAVSERGRFCVVLSGGRTPASLYHLLGAPPWSRQVPWAHTHVFWGDERCVSPDHADSNYGAAQRDHLSRVPVPACNVHRMRGETDPEEAARAYEEELMAFFGESPPQFDLILLGLGTDGHTASLFPGSPALDASGRLCVATLTPDGRSRRLTLTLPVINLARRVMFLATGQEKAAIFRRVFFRAESDLALPALRVAPAGDVMWLVDEGAAMELVDADVAVNRRQ